MFDFIKVAMDQKTILECLFVILSSILSKLRIDYSNT